MTIHLPYSAALSRFSFSQNSVGRDALRLALHLALKCCRGMPFHIEDLGLQIVHGGLDGVGGRQRPSFPQTDDDRNRGQLSVPSEARGEWLLI
ncbi:hypothetical protein EVAR_80667_1 [Eumeta japonica]|uniref:Uncharacterized protein n=1 Tax=Eumeta variegata TaxID=151549 RepID=A0A4C1U3L2_EUMVA|nr:hypothetical protein EVAR_80667_1 [Eumeta japonica]